LKKLKVYFWISIRLLFNKKFFFGGSAPLSLLGLSLGVAALIASQAVMRGFEDSLQKAMVDVTADIQIVKRGKLIDDWDHFKQQIMSQNSEVTQMSRFAYAEAVMAHQGRVTGVLVQGLLFQDVEKILNLKNRIREGRLAQQPSEITVGMGLAKKMGLKIDSSIYLAVPLASSLSSNTFRRQTAEFKIVGFVDFGKNEWNERLILSHLSDLQKLIEVGDRFTGAFLKIRDSQKVHQVGQKMSEQLGLQYNVMNWYDVNKNLFEAVALEKVVIFFVVFLIVIVAAFNISSTLYVLIRQRYKDISILKTLGLGSRSVQLIFSVQGFLLASLGSFLGLFLGFILCQGFMFIQKHFSLISGAVYKLDRIDVSMSFWDFFIIYLATLAACLLASRGPAAKASRLQIVEGLREYS